MLRSGRIRFMLVQSRSDRSTTIYLVFEKAPGVGEKKTMGCVHKHMKGLIIPRTRGYEHIPFTTTEGGA